ncbi:hypothetical protein Leryth_023156 [Lithospermum erythrorhizon]|nr:hypothetical protein Leryth_023156 [Lithospermum erythrorhizon]
MRSLLFRHEIKAKRIKKIKSKTYHKLQKKDRLKAVSKAVETDPEVAKELAMKQERKRAEERMTQKHKNRGKWAKRILARGIDVQDDGTRAAISEQLQQHAELTRKMNSMRDSSSSDDSSDDDGSDQISGDSDPEGALKLLNKAKEKTLEVVEGEEELPKSGVLSLPFMVRGMKKMKEAAEQEATLALQEYDLSLKQLEDNNVVEGKMSVGPSGRRVFGAVQKQVKEAKNTNAEKIDHFDGNSDNDSEDGFVTKEDLEDDNGKFTFSQTDINIDPDVFREVSEIGHDSVFKSFEDIAKDPGLNTTYDVAIFASNSWKKMKNLSGDNMGRKSEARQADQDPVMQNHKIMEEEGDDDSDTDDGGQMVDGILSSGPKSSYELPSQEELIRRAFAGDDVEEEFHKDKDEVLNEENPEPEKPVLLPGWGQWTHVQKKKGIPSWMLAEHEAAKKKREEALKKRKDAHLNHVIISEKLDKKAEKLHTKTLPFPFKSTDAFEQSIRMPIGPDFNPATAVGALTRPEVVKKSGVSIKPIQYEDVNPYERSEDHKRKGPKNQKRKGNGKAKGKMIKAH